MPTSSQSSVAANCRWGRRVRSSSRIAQSHILHGLQRRCSSSSMLKVSLRGTIPNVPTTPSQQKTEYICIIEKYNFSRSASMGIGFALPQAARALSQDHFFSPRGMFQLDRFERIPVRARREFLRGRHTCRSKSRRLELPALASGSRFQAEISCIGADLF